jgi:catechol O-methyltransferase
MAAFWKRVPFLRWSFLRMGLNAKHLFKEWQVGDGREERLAQHVLANARKGDPADAIRVIDAFCYESSFMMNVGDEKGAILDAAVRRAAPRRILELGTYCGYSALRLAVTAPEAHTWSIEFNPANADIARRIHAHAGVADRITVVVGTLGDGGKTLSALREQHGFARGSVDFVFVDHTKDAYLPDLKRILEEGWLKSRAIVVADNIRFPGAPDYLAFMREHEGREWRTQEHATHVEYQSVLPDLVLESEYLAAA